MKLGEKLRQLRTAAGMTQRTLADGIVTRNMLSLIESGEANPSLDTLSRLAERLEVSVAYFFTEEDDLFFFRKLREMPTLRELYARESYEACLDLLQTLGGTDDETALLAAECHLGRGRELTDIGAMSSATRHLRAALEATERTVYDTARIRALASLYLAVATNVQAPLLEFNTEAFAHTLGATLDVEFYHYVMGDAAYSYTISPELGQHLRAREAIRERRYYDALALLEPIAENRGGHRVCLTFGIYSDLETCYRQMGDYERAYRYASKRMSMMEGFKS